MTGGAVEASPSSTAAPRPTLLGRLGPVAVVLGVGIALRLIVAVVAHGQGEPDDLATFLSWAQTLATTGPGTFYATADSANYPPAFMGVLWAIGHLGGGGALIKVTAILADAGIGALLWFAGRRWLGERAGLAAAALYLLVPVTWYDSAIWGQVAAVVALVMLAGLVALVEGHDEAAAGLAGLALLTKPQGLVLLVVLVPVLVRRRLLARGTGPALPAGPWPGIAERYRRWATTHVGPIRLGTAAVAFLAVVALGALPFDIWRFAPPPLAGVPILGQLAGVAGLVTSDAGHYQALTANAYNLWSLVGDPSLASVISGGGPDPGWISDALPIVAGIPAVVIGTVLLAATGLLVAGGLLRRDERTAVVLGLALAAFAFYALPTRVHERYLVPFFAPAALLAAVSWRGAVGYVVLAVLNALNLHGVLHRGGFGPPAGPLLTWVPDLFTHTPVVGLIAVGQTIAFVVVLALWVATLRRRRV